MFSVMCAVTCLIGVNCFGAGQQNQDQLNLMNLQRHPGDVFITIYNQTGANLYVYVFKYNNNPGTIPGVQVNMGGSSGVLPAGNKGIINLANYPDFGSNNGNRIYFSDTPLTSSILAGYAPDEFNSSVGGNQNWSFAEYNYNPNDDPAGSMTFIIDLSFIDGYSFPMTIKFTQPSGGSSYTGCQWNFVYGLTSMGTIKTELNAQGTAWGNLVDDDADHAATYTRIVGPDKVWAAGATAPARFNTFTTTYPYNATQLFPASGSQSAYTNFNGWLNLLPPLNPWGISPYSDPTPETTGYAVALLAAAGYANDYGDSSYRRGFYIYCQDQHAGSEFDYVPEGTPCMITVYSKSF